VSSPKKQKHDKDSKHKIEEIKKDNIEAEKKVEIESKIKHKRRIKIRTCTPNLNQFNIPGIFGPHFP